MPTVGRFVRGSYESRPGNSEVNTWTPSQAMELFRATNVFVGTVINATGDSYMYHEPAYVLLAAHSSWEHSG